VFRSSRWILQSVTCVQARNEGGGKGGTFLLAPNQCEDAELLWEAPKSPNTVASTLFNTVNLLPKELRFDHVGSKLKFCPIKKKFGSKVNLLFTDTDSLCCEIETEDFFKDISADVQEKFDTSNLSPNHPSAIPTGINKKVAGMCKDEAGGEIIEEFVGLRTQLYAIKKLDGEEEKIVRVSREMS